MATRLAVAAFALIALTASASFADHERFLVGEMRLVDPSSSGGILSISGACTPSHDRDTLECYFTVFGLAKSHSEMDLKQKYNDLVRQLNTDNENSVRGLKKSYCD